MYIIDLLIISFPFHGKNVIHVRIYSMIISKRYQWLVRLYNAVKDRNLDEVKLCIRHINQCTRFISISAHEWKLVFQLCDIQGVSTHGWAFIEWLIEIQFPGPYKDYKSRIRDDDPRVEIIRMFADLHMYSKRYLAETLCKLGKTKLLLDLVEAGSLKLCYRFFYKHSFLAAIMISEAELTDQVKEQTLRWYRLASNSSYHRTWCRGVDKDVLKTAKDLVYFERNDALAFLIEHCNLAKYTKNHQLFNTAIRYGNIGTIKVLLEHNLEITKKDIEENKASWRKRLNIDKVLYKCAKHGHFDMLEYFLDKGVCINELESMFSLITQSFGERFRARLIGILRNYGYEIPWDLHLSSSCSKEVSLKRYANKFEPWHK